MKKYIALLLFVFMIFSFTACTNNTNSNQDNGMSTFIETYKNTANEYIEKGDIESAIKVLEEGVSKFDDESLKTLLAELKSEIATTTSSGGTEVPVSTSEVTTTAEPVEATTEEQTEVPSTMVVEVTEPQPFDFGRYIGWWTETEYEDYLTNGGMFLSVNFDGGTYVGFNISFAQSGGRRVADTNFLILRETLESITDNTIENAFTDSFGNNGVAHIEFSDNQVICTISNLTAPYGGTDWGIYNGEYVLSHRLTSAY